MPIEPEYFKRANDEDFDVETSRVDELFKVSSIAKSALFQEQEKTLLMLLKGNTKQKQAKEPPNNEIS